MTQVRHRSLFAALCLCLVPSLAFAQTEEIQREIDTRLWFARLYESFRIGGVPPAVTLMTLAAVLVAMIAAVWLWRSRRGADPGAK